MKFDFEGGFAGFEFAAGGGDFRVLSTEVLDCGAEVFKLGFFAPGQRFLELGVHLGLEGGLLVAEGFGIRFDVGHGSGLGF